MRSPFQIFRKHQKVALAIVLIMIMFAFTVEGAVRGLSTGEVPVAVSVGMAAMLGALIGAVVGIQTGKPKEYAAAGVLICAVVALVVVFSIGKRASAVETNIGNLSGEKLNELVNRKLAVNNFVEAVFYKTMGDRPNFFAQYELQQKRFGFGGYAPTREAEAILTFLCEHEADRMKIEVSDESINEFIHSINPGRALSEGEFAEICRSMRLGETRLYDWLRAEMRARTAFFMAFPRIIPTPEDYWDIYRKLHVSQSLEVAAVPVEPFTASVPEPTEQEITTLYNEFSQVLPNRLGPGRPGFLQPRKMRLAYFETRYDEILAAQPPVTDQEVEEFYNKNKEMFRNRQFPESLGGGPAPKLPGGEQPSGPDLKPQEGPALDPSAAPKTAPGETKPVAPDSEPKSTAPDAPNPEPAKESTKDVPPAPTGPPKDEKPKGSSQIFPSNVRPGRLDAAPAAEYENGTLLALADEEPAAEPAEAAPPSTSADEDKPAAEENEPVSAQPAAEPTTAAPAGQPAAQPNDDPDAPVEAPHPLPEFRPLDDTVKAEIRNIIVEQRARAAIKEAVDAIVNKVMYPLRDKFDPATKKANQLLLTENKQSTPNPDDVAKAEQEFTQAKAGIDTALEKYAADNKLNFKVTDLLTYEELGEAKNHSIGLLVDPLDMSSGGPANTMTLRDRLIETRSQDIYAPIVAEDELTKNRFALWKIEDVESHVPDLAAPGIREQVIAAHKHMKAQELAEKRANALAEQARESKKGVAAFLTGQTATGAEGSPPLETRITPQFSWLSQSTAPPTGMFDQSVPEVSEITAIAEPNTQARDALMRILFDEMKTGDIRTVADSTRTHYYVVQVYNRSPDTPEGLERQKSAFLRENLFASNPLFGGPASGYSYLLGDKQQNLIQNWLNELNRKYEVKVRIDADVLE